ncbi:MAG: 30S ribosomal protein S6 [Deltaproteobacteria bacterium]|uniref:Small ribosomal subunit protein bS6 n=1 Tax=Candidatus Zymogenus saltonus TaxID=2844893 RepID=A0A9D8KIA0_9DELT|nr:30S ribosomal protein S6 [Candidatus Zymogenus saltonus]
MRTYETIIVLDPDLSDEDNEKVIKKIEGVIESQKGSIVFIDHWGKRKLAYRVKKKFKGDYYRFIYYGSGNIISVLERNLRITEEVYKFLTVKIADEEIEIEPEKIEKLERFEGEDQDVLSPSGFKDIKGDADDMETDEVTGSDDFEEEKED